MSLAIEGLPASASTVGGDGKQLDRMGLHILERRIEGVVPNRFSEGRVLRAGWGYGTGKGHALAEVFLGKPFGVGTPFDSVQVCRVFLHNGRVLCVESFTRISGEEERVDTEPPRLNERNWFLLTEETSGYISLDGGTTWDRVSVDCGFEGIVWSISRLAKGMPRLWGFYLYMAH